MGWKDWQIGEVVTESDFQSLVQNQVVQVYADSTARTAALGTAVSDGMTSYLTATDSLEIYDGSAWVAVSSADPTFTANRAIISNGTGSLAVSAVTATELATLSGITASTTELNYVDGVTSGIQAQLDGKQAIVSGVSDTEIGYLDGVTSAIQTQLNGKVSTTNGAVTTAATGSNVVRNITLSTATPTGGSDGDVWLVYTP